MNELLEIVKPELSLVMPHRLKTLNDNTNFESRINSKDSMNHFFRSLENLVDLGPEMTFNDFHKLTLFKNKSNFTINGHHGSQSLTSLVNKYIENPEKTITNLINYQKNDKALVQEYITEFFKKLKIMGGGKELPEEIQPLELLLIENADSLNFIEKDKNEQSEVVSNFKKKFEILISDLLNTNLKNINNEVLASNLVTNSDETPDYKNYKERTELFLQYLARDLEQHSYSDSITIQKELSKILKNKSSQHGLKASEKLFSDIHNELNSEIQRTSLFSKETQKIKKDLCDEIINLIEEESKTDASQTSNDLNTKIEKLSEYVKPSLELAFPHQLSNWQKIERINQPKNLRRLSSWLNKVSNLNPNMTVSRWLELSNINGWQHISQKLIKQEILNMSLKNFINEYIKDSQEIKTKLGVKPETIRQFKADLLTSFEAMGGFIDMPIKDKPLKSLLVKDFTESLKSKLIGDKDQVNNIISDFKTKIKNSSSSYLTHSLKSLHEQITKSDDIRNDERITRSFLYSKLFINLSENSNDTNVDIIKREICKDIVFKAHDNNLEELKYLFIDILKNTLKYDFDKSKLTNLNTVNQKNNISQENIPSPPLEDKEEEKIKLTTFQQIQNELIKYSGHGKNIFEVYLDIVEKAPQLNLPKKYQVFLNQETLGVNSANLAQRQREINENLINKVPKYSYDELKEQASEFFKLQIKEKKN